MATGFSANDDANPAGGEYTGASQIDAIDTVESFLSREQIYVLSGRPVDAGMVNAMLDEIDSGFDVVAGSWHPGAYPGEECVVVCTQKGMSALGSELTLEAVRRAAVAGLKVKVVEDPRVMTRRIAVVVPAYNEERLIGGTLAGIPSYVSRIYAVDDGSRDRTSEIIDGMDDDRIVHIRHFKNKGVGAAIVSGYRQALADGMDVVAVMAGDGQMDPKELPGLLKPILDGRADYSKGNRLRTKGDRKGMRPWRLFGNLLLSVLNKVSSGYWHVNDPQNGYTAITREALEAIGPDSIYTYYGYCNDMLVRLNAAGMRVVDVSMPSRYGSERSSIKYVPYIIKVSSLLLRDFLWRLASKYLLGDFHPLIIFYTGGAALLIATAPIAVASALGAADPVIPLITSLAGLQSVLLAMDMDRKAGAGRRPCR